MGKIKHLKIKLIRKWQGLEPGEFPARFGKGQFVDLIKLRGGRMKLISHTSNPRRPQGTLTITPFQDNHGFLVRFTNKDGYSPWTNSISFDDIYQLLGKGIEKKA